MWNKIRLILLELSDPNSQTIFEGVSKTNQQTTNSRQLFVIFLKKIMVHDYL